LKPWAGYCFTVSKKVSNPWREAIEVGQWRNSSIYYRFPILGGRLLKRNRQYTYRGFPRVSNPWREAIEEKCRFSVVITYKVSNPWREAIEVETGNINVEAFHVFPILGGRLLKPELARLRLLLYVSNPWREAIEDVDTGY